MSIGQTLGLLSLLFVSMLPFVDVGGRSKEVRSDHVSARREVRGDDKADFIVVATTSMVVVVDKRKGCARVVRCDQRHTWPSATTRRACKISTVLVGVAFAT